MPKISAATVKEHHAQMFRKLVDAAEKILREAGPNALTAGSVANAAGIARNSIYRYVGSIDDLRIIVLERYLPLWISSVEKRVNRNDDPRKQVLDLAIASLEMAQTTGHSWLISVMRHRGGMRAKQNSAPQQHNALQQHSGAQAVGEKVGAAQTGENPHRIQKHMERSPYTSAAVANFHKNLGMEIYQLWKEIDPKYAVVNAQINSSLIEAGMKLLDHNCEFDAVVHSVTAAISGLFPKTAHAAETQETKRAK